MRRAKLFAAVVLAAGVASTQLPLLPPPAASAKDDKADKQKELEKIKRENSLKKVANAFSVKDVAGLLGHVPSGQKISLAGIGADPAGDYSPEQARGVLDKYFEGIEQPNVDTTNDGKDGYEIKGLVGRFPLSYRKKGENKRQKATLLINLGPLDATDRYTLAKLSIV